MSLFSEANSWTNWFVFVHECSFYFTSCIKYDESDLLFKANVRMMDNYKRLWDRDSVHIDVTIYNKQVNCFFRQIW